MERKIALLKGKRVMEKEVQIVIFLLINFHFSLDGPVIKMKTITSFFQRENGQQDPEKIVRLKTQKSTSNSNSGESLILFM